MTTTSPLSPASSLRTRDLVDLDGERRFAAFEHVLGASPDPAFRVHYGDLRSFVVVDGVVELEYVGADGAVSAVRVEKFDGWHAEPGSVYRFRAAAPGRATVIEAGTVLGETVELADLPAPGPASATDADGRPGCRRVSGYRVDKPWGFELWYTANVDGASYAVKQIHMTAGHQSSLQSHRFKAETNYVVDGEATVLNGLPAPEDLGTVVDVGRIPVAVYGPGQGWTSAPGILHRVIARADYTSVEVSTPELDDVIRWQDDTGRGNGRVAAEHAGGVR
jgi:mannose-6-phosphate isomerase-like protein (cupin superfamily)